MNRRRAKRLMSDMNVVPYIDVMLVLLIIFMITAPLVTQGVKVDLPQTASQPIETTEQEPLIVSVNAQGQLFVNFGGDEDEPLDREGLLTRIAALLRTNPGIPVYMRGDRAVEYGRVVEVMAMLQAAGVANVGLVSEPPSD